jgi:hypothetical protein
VTRRFIPKAARTDPAIDNLVSATGFTIEQVTAGVVIMRSGRADIIAAVINGVMTVEEALASIKRRSRNG